MTRNRKRDAAALGVRVHGARAQVIGAFDETCRGTYWFDLAARRPLAARIKRILDGTVAAILLVIVAPVVLFRRETVRRIGFRGNLFAMYVSPFARLLNVLEGTMSLVGPRPLAPDDVHDVNARRLSVRPGLTGLWRIEETEETMLERRYISEWSLALDLEILLRSAVKIAARLFAQS